ncbi:MAG TPA: hypothetical protein VFA26_12030 [Gemmataceae bacterium]|nr:hypothetical protein [Gemmataceae bacterium]
MTRPTFRFALQSFMRRRPFKPFLIELFSGDRFLVSHLETVRLHGDLVHYVSPQFENRLFDHVSVCQLLDVPALRES